ncbi:hypothetical protein JOC33_002789 [Thalassobacillus pellis]|nr:hypothetical protein [Thalassobacillus pellis]
MNDICGFSMYIAPLSNRLPILPSRVVMSSDPGFDFVHGQSIKQEKRQGK